MNAAGGLAAALLLAAYAAHSSAADAAALRRTLNADDLFRVQELTDPQVSPDGLWVAYVVSTNDREPDEPRTAIWLVSWDGSRRLALTSAAAGTAKPRWSPDGRTLAFVATSVGAASDQIMLLDRRGGDARQLIDAHGAISAYAWSPDGKRIAIAMDKAAAGKNPQPIVLDAWHFKDEDAGYLDERSRTHLYLLDVESKQIDPLTTDPHFIEDLPAWSPDGKEIAFIRSTEKDADQDGRADIDVIAARPGAMPRQIVRPYSPNRPRLAWSPDGTLIAYLQGLEPKFNAYMQDRLFVVPRAGGAPRALTDKLDRAVTSFAFTGDSAITIAVEDDGSNYPARVELATGAITRQVKGRFVISSPTSGAGHTALLQSNDNAFDEVYALEGEALRKLTTHNDAFLSELALGAVEDIQFKSKDGAEIHGLIVKPPSFVRGRKYPTLLWIHGGPNGQDEHSLVFDCYQFQPQMFAARGFVVLSVNYRGSSGRGIEFATAIFADWGHKEVADLLAGVDHLITLGIADRDRLAIGGWSYGGILTDYTIATDQRFKVAISAGGSGNQLSLYGSDQYILQDDNELGPPWSNTALWLRVSYPLLHADRIHTPTLFIGGSRDFNVPISGGEQMYQALRTLAVPTQLVVYPDEHHVVTRPSFLKDIAERVPAWIDRYIGQ